MKRLSTGLIISAAWLALLILQSFTLLWLVFIAVGGVALYEYFSMSMDSRERHIIPLAILIGLIPLVAALGKSVDLVFAALFIAMFASSLLLFSTYPEQDNGLALLAKLCCGLCFIGACAAHLPLLVAKPDGVSWLAILTIITIASDTGAYYAGTNFGRTKLCPSISPGKTVEGLLGGIATSLIIAGIAKSFLLPGVSYTAMAAVTIVVTLVGVGGDLIESIFKRSCRIKDSGSILPGHGGVYDRIDSLLTAAPALYYLIHFHFV